MIDALFESKKISPQEFKLYKLFSSELGSEVLKTMEEELFWEEPNESEMTAGVLGLYEGRRSFLRSMKIRIEKVQQAINKQLTPEANNVGTNNNIQ